MRRPVEFVLPEQTVTVAARKMRDANIGFLPVCDAERRVIGAVTDRDLAIRVCAPELGAGTTVGEIMTLEVVACHRADDVLRAEELMAEYHKSRIIVTGDDGKLVGVISLSDVADADEPRAAETMHAVSQREVLDEHGHKQEDPDERRRALDVLRRLRDEVRVRVHLAGMEAKESWSKLEPRVDKLERQLDATGARISTELRTALAQARASLESLRERLRGPSDPPTRA